jgi:hypothetical protein
MKHYANPSKPHHVKNVAAFERAIAGLGVSLFFPNQAAAPWYVQAKIRTEGGYDLFINFWPCALKAQIDGERAVQGEGEIRSAVLRWREIAAEEDAPVVEDF